MALSHELTSEEQRMRGAASDLRKAALERAVGNPNVAGFARKSFREPLEGFGEVIVNFSAHDDSAPLRVSYPAVLPTRSEPKFGRVAIEIEQTGIVKSTFEDTTSQTAPIGVVVDPAEIEMLTSALKGVNETASPEDTAYQH